MIRLRVSNNAFTCFSVLGRKKSSNENQSLASRGEGLTFCRLNTRMPTHAIRTGAPDKRIVVDLAGILGGHMASADGGLVPRRVEYGEGCPFRSRPGGSGRASSAPPAGSENGFWRILKATGRSFLYLYDKIWGGQFVLASPLRQILGDLSLRPSVIYAHG